MKVIEYRVFNNNRNLDFLNMYDVIDGIEKPRLPYIASIKKVYNEYSRFQKEPDLYSKLGYDVKMRKNYGKCTWNLYPKIEDENSDSQNNDHQESYMNDDN